MMATISVVLIEYILYVVEAQRFLTVLSRKFTNT